MNQQAYNSLLSALDDAVYILDRNRTPDPALIAAFDTLKQARAMVVRAVEQPAPSVIEEYLELVAA
ncbi:MAG TPA: hypothetical protein VM029_07550 [Opitutaceae bacterium]|nr:hypothetical protein [Opitutaceae bacterium]